MPVGYWRKLLDQYSTLPCANDISDREIEIHLSHMLVRGRLKLYPVKLPSFSESPPQNRTLKTSDGINYRFADVSTLLMGTPGETRSFKTKAEAEQFLAELNPELKQLQIIARDLEVPVSSNAYKDPAQLTAAVSEAMAAGEVIVIVDKTSSVPAEEKPPEEEKSTVGNRKVELGTAAVAMTAAANQVVAEEPVCELTSLTVKCKHGRSVEIKAGAETMPELSIISSATHEPDFDKVSAIVKGKALCGEHIDSSSSIQPEPVSTSKSAACNNYTLASEPLSSPLDYLWLPSIKPRVYKIYPNTHKSFDPSGVVVNAYPKIKWSGEIGYSFGKKESSHQNQDGNVSNLHKSGPSKFEGKLELDYDGTKKDLAVDYKTSIESILTKLDWITQKTDKVLGYFNGGSSFSITVGWPSIKIEYSTELAEDDGGPGITSQYELKVGASPLIDINGSVDFFPVLMKTIPATHSVYKVLEEVKKGIGNEKGFAHLEGEIKLELTVGSGVSIKFISSGTNGMEDSNNKGESSIDIRFQLEGSVSAKGHVWVIKFEKSYKVGVKSGFVGKLIVDKDDEGFYWYSRFLFNGLVIYFTKYDKIEKSINSSSRRARARGIDLASISSQSTKEWVCIEPDPDEEAPYETDKIEAKSDLDASDKHYLLKY